MAENKTKSNNFVSPNRFSCLNNYGQFENSVDFNKEIAHVTWSNILTTSKGSTDISHSKERSKKLIRDQTRHHNTHHYPILAVTKNIQKNLLETEKLRRTDPTLLQLPLSETQWLRKILVTNYQENSTINTML